MNEKEKMIERVQSFSKWMEENAGHQMKSINEIFKGVERPYETIVELHLLNGNVITLNNNCIESFEMRKYIGDELFIDNGMINVCYPLRGYRNIIIPLSSVCYIEGHSKDVDWELYNIDYEQWTKMSVVADREREIKWEQRRYEIAKDIMASFATSCKRDIYEWPIESRADEAVKMAEALIHTLRHQNNTLET